MTRIRVEDSAIGTQSQLNPSPVRVHPVMGSAGERTTEVLRLLVNSPHDGSTLDALGISKEDMAAHLCLSLPEPGGALYTADDGLRLQGLLYLEPRLGPSAAFGAHIWQIGPFVVDPDAPEGTVPAMLDHALEHIEAPVDHLFARVPAADHRVVRGLHRYGFNTSVGEAVVVGQPDGNREQAPVGYSFGPLADHCLEAVTDLLFDRRHCTAFLRQPASDPERLRGLSRQELLAFVNDPDRGALVAFDGDGAVAGLAAYRQTVRLAAGNGRRLAGLEHFQIRADLSNNGVGSLLARTALARLGIGGVDAVVGHVLLDDERDSCRLDAITGAGFQVTGSNLVLDKAVDR
jgi:hypothetical protein